MPPKVAVIPIMDNPNARFLQAFNLTLEEYQILKLCAGRGIEPSKTTAQRRSLLRRLEQNHMVRIGRLSKVWELSDFGDTVFKALGICLGANFASEPAKVLRFDHAGLVNQ